MVAQNIFFGIIAFAMVFSAIRMVTVKNVVHAALWLMGELAGAAGQFIILGSEFIAATQVLVYLGAILILFIFGIMLTRTQVGKDSDLDNYNRLVSAVIGFVLLGVLGAAMWDRFEDV